MTMHDPTLAAALAETKAGAALAIADKDMAPTFDTAQIASDLKQLAAGMDRRFVEAGNTLATAIETTDSLTGVLRDINAAIDDASARAAISALTGIAERLADLPKALNLREASLEAAESNSGKLVRHLGVMRKLFTVLRIYSLNIKIASGGEAAFVQFVEDLNRRLDGGLAELDEFAEILDRLDPNLKEAWSAIEPLRHECSQVVPEVPDRLAADAGMLRRHMEKMGDLARQTLSIVSDIQLAVGNVLGALQVGDSTRQRVEHVVETLDILDGWAREHALDPATEQAVRAHIFALLSAQLAAAAKDFSSGTGVLLSSLREIGPRTSDLLSMMEDDGHAKGSQALQKVESSIAQMSELTHRLRTTDEQSGRLVELVASSLAATEMKMKVLRRLRIELRNVATNTSLLCLRSGDVGRAVLVVAKEVDKLCTQLGEELDKAIVTIQSLADNSSAIRDEGHQAGGEDSLGTALSIVQKGCNGNESGIEQAQGDAHRLIALLKRTDTELASELALEGAMLAASDALAGGATDRPALSDAALESLKMLLPVIHQLYSMAQERDIHREMSPFASLDDTEEASSELLFDEEDDDGLF